MKTDVIIIGAGPTGLSLACQLVRYGIDFIIVERNEGITHLSKALGVHARTLEIYEQLGLAEQAVERGAIAGKLRVVVGGKVRGGFDLSSIGQNLSPYPFMLILEQSKNEQLLYEYLQSRRKDVLWNTTLESFSQDGAGVRAVVKSGDGEPQIVEAKYLVGCDGAGSRVRQSLGLSFEGSTFEQLFYVADAQIDWELSHDAIYACLARDSFVAFFPMEGNKRWRIVGNLPGQAHRSEAEIDYEEIEQKIKTETELSLDITNVNWFSTYRVHTRRVEKFSEGRCFLAGDAAHIHTPAGGQGMNTGIQDAYNLAWKLGLILRGYADESLLDTYNDERLENAKQLIETTDKIFEVESGSDWLVSFVRTTVFPPLANYIFSLDVVKNAVFPLLSQIGINYRESRLSLHSGDEKFKVKAGDRMPYLLVDGKNIYDRLREPKFHLLTFSDGQSYDQKMGTKIKSEYNNLVDYHAMPLYPRVAEIFGFDKTFSVLLRPDNYIGFISPKISPGDLEVYLAGGADKATD